MAQQGYIGRNPGDGRTIVNRQTTNVNIGIQTSFTMTVGYEIGYLDVYLNGSKQVETLDYTASDGSTIDFSISSPPVQGDVLEFVAFETLNITNIKSARRNFNVGQDLSVDGKVTIGSSLTVASDLVVNGTFTTINTEILDVEDKTIGIASTSSPSNTTADGAGIVIYGGTDGDKSLTWNTEKSNFVLVGGGVSIGTGVTISTPAANVLAFSVNSAEKARFNNFGAFTVGYEGEAWKESTYVGVLQAGSGAWIGQTPAAGARAEWVNNAYYDSVNTRWEYIAADEANRMYFENGEMHLQSAAAGSADGAITWNEKLAMTVGGDFKIGPNAGIGITISSSGNVDSIGIGTFSSNFNVGGTPPWAQASGNHRMLSVSGNTTDGTAFLNLGNGVATTNADFDLTRIRIYNGATEVARITGETGDSNNDSGQIMFDTKESGGSLTERLILNREGHLLPSTDSAYDIGTSSVRFRNFYADTLYGNGSNLTGITQTTINNNANNRVITGSGTANTLEAESALTFDGTAFNLTGNANIAGTLRFEAGGTSWNTTYSRPQLGRQADGELRLGSGSDSASQITFYTAPSAGGTLAERMRITSDGHAKIGPTANRNLGGLSVQRLHIEGTDGGGSGIGLVNNQNSTGYASFRFGKSRGTSVGSNTVLQNGDTLGGLIFCGADGTDIDCIGAEIKAFVDGDPGSNDMPGRITFHTAPDGSSTTTQRLSIRADGKVKIGSSTAGVTNEKCQLTLTHNNTNGIGIIDIDSYGSATLLIQSNWSGSAANGVPHQAFGFGTPHAYPLTFQTSGSERMRIESGGAVVIGGTAYTQGGATPQLALYGSSGRQFKIMNSGSQTTGMQLQNSTTGYGEDAGIQFACLGGGQGYLINQTNNQDFMLLYTRVSGSGKHIMQIYNDGKIGQQSNTDCLMLSTAQDGSGSNYFLRGSKNSTTPGGGNDVVWIYEDGDLYNANGTYSQSSDVSLKENIVDANSQWADIKGLKFRNFNFKASTGLDTHKQIGLVAQEAETVSPGLVKDRDKIVKTTNEDGTVTETVDGTTKTVKLSVLYMKGMKALQEAMTRIETLESENTALKARVTTLEGS